MSLPILRRIDKNDTESIEEAVADGFYYVEDLLTYELSVPGFLIDVRPARASDIPKLILIAQAELKHSRLYADLRVPREVAASVYADRVRHAFETATVFVACRHSRSRFGFPSIIVGFAVLRDLEIELIAVDAKYQRCGVGKQLVEACALGRNGVLKVKTQGRNYRARSFYEKLGFSQTKIEKDFHKYEDTIDGTQGFCGQPSAESVDG